MINRLVLLAFIAFAFSACTPALTTAAPAQQPLQSLYPQAAVQQANSDTLWRSYSAEGVSISLPAAWEEVGKDSELAQYSFSDEYVNDPSYNELLAAVDTTPAVLPVTDLFLDSDQLNEPMSLALYAALTARGFQTDLDENAEFNLEFVNLPVGEVALLTYMYHGNEDGVNYYMYVRYYMIMKGQKSDQVHILSMATSGEYADAYASVFDQIAASLQS